MDFDKAWAARSQKPEEWAAKLDNRQVAPAVQPAKNLRTEVKLEPISTSAGMTAALEARRQRALATTRDLRLAMEQELRNSATRHAAREAERKRAELTEKSDIESLTIFDKLREEMTSVAYRYADIKGPLLRRKVVLTADGAGAPRPASFDKELAEVQGALDKADASQRVEAQALQAKADKESKGLYSNIDTLVAEHVQRLLAERLQSIEDKLSKENFDLNLILPDKPLTPEISTGEESIHFHPLSKAETATTGTGARQQWESIARESLRREIELWVKAKGWRLSSTRAGAADVTQQFIEETAQ